MEDFLNQYKVGFVTGFGWGILACLLSPMLAMVGYLVAAAYLVGNAIGKGTWKLDWDVDFAFLKGGKGAQA